MNINFINFYRNKRINNILKEFPDIPNKDRKWLIHDLEHRYSKLNTSLLYNRYINIDELTNRIKLILQASEILRIGSYKIDKDSADTVRAVYLPIVGNGRENIEVGDTYEGLYDLQESGK